MHRIAARLAALIGSFAITVALLHPEPIIEISTLIGGSGADVINDVALDDNGDTLVVGSTSSPDFPTVDGSPSGAGPDLDAFFLRLREVVDQDGNPFWTIVQSEIFGGSDDDEAQSVKPAEEGVIVDGDARSADFPGPGGPFPGRFSILVPRETAAASFALSSELARKLMEEKRTELDSIGRRRGFLYQPGQILVISEDDDGNVFVDDNLGGPMQEMRIASGAKNAKGEFSGTRLAEDATDGDFSFYLIEEVSSTMCKVTRFPGKADGTLAPAGRSINLSMAESVETFGVVTTEREVETPDGSGKLVPDKVYVFKKGTGPFAVAGDFSDSDFKSFDFAEIGDNVVAICLDAQNLRPIKMGEAEVQDIRDAIVQPARRGKKSSKKDREERLTAFGQSVLGAGGKKSGRTPPPITLRSANSAGLTKERPRPGQQVDSADVVVQFVEPGTLQRLEAYSFGGDGNEEPLAAALNEEGDVYVAGSTDGELPLTPNAITEEPAGESDGFLVKVADPQPPVLAADAIVGAADFRGGAIAAGSILSMFAQGAGGLVVAELDDEGKFPAALGGVRVLFDGTPGRMIFTTPGQSNLIAPFSIDGQSTVNVELEVDGLASEAVELTVAPTRPQIFSASQQGTGPAALLNQDFSTNGESNPAARGSVIQIFLTGGGQTDPPGEDGALAPTAEPLPRFSDVRVFVGGVECQVVYAGAAPGLVHGVGQINVIVDESVPPGDDVPLEVQIGGVGSQPGITVAIS